MPKLVRIVDWHEVEQLTRELDRLEFAAVTRDWGTPSKMALATVRTVASPTLRDKLLRELGYEVVA